MGNGSGSEDDKNWQKDVQKTLHLQTHRGAILSPKIESRSKPFSRKNSKISSLTGDLDVCYNFLGNHDLDNGNFHGRMQVDHEKQAKIYEENENWAKALSQYQILHKKKGNLETLEKLSEMNYNLKNYNKAGAWAEVLVEKASMDNSGEVRDSFLTSCTSPRGIKSFGKVLQNSINCHKNGAQQTYETKYIDKAIEHTNMAKSLLEREDADTFEKAILIKIASQVSSLEKIKQVMSLKAEIKQLKELGDRIHTIFQQKESQLGSEEDILKNRKFWNIFTEKYQSKLMKLKKAEEDLEEDQNLEAPPYYECIINYSLMEKPTVASDGHSYERQTLDKLINHHSGVSPMTRDKLDTKIKYPNLALKRAVFSHKNSLTGGNGKLSSRKSSGI